MELKPALSYEEQIEGGKATKTSERTKNVAEKAVNVLNRRGKSNKNK